MYKFAPASKDETIVFGSARPGYEKGQVDEWIEFMQAQGIRRICCLLTGSQLTKYSNLLDAYRQTLGSDRVCWSPIEDFQLAGADKLINQILLFLAVAEAMNERVVVHCSGGIGRTGQAIAAWLVARRGFSNEAAIAAVKASGRNPHEAVILAPFHGRNPWQVAAELHLLLNECRRLGQY